MPAPTARVTWWTVLLMAGALLAGGLSAGGWGPSAAHAGEGAPTPGATLGDVDVSTWIEGPAAPDTPRIQVITAVATWSGPSLLMLPALDGLAARHGEAVDVVAVSTEPEAALRRGLRRASVPDVPRLPHGPTLRVGSDPDGSVFQQVFGSGARELPHTVVVDAEGHVAWTGHPLAVAPVVAALVRGTWDPARHARRLAEARQVTAIQARLTNALAERDFDAAQRILDAAVQSHPDNVVLHQLRFRTLLIEAKRPVPAYAGGARLLALLDEDAQGLNEVAWMVVDDPHVPKRDLAFARKAAERANALTDGRDAAIVDTLARVHFEQGDRERAIALQRQAVALATDPTLKAELEATLTRYLATAD